MSTQVWPAFLATRITKSSSDQYNMPCPYILSKKVLGTGSYSHVYECKNAVTGRHYAAKRYSKKLIYGMETMLQSEFQILKALLNGHKNILLMVDYFETSDYFYLVTELANGGELFDKITSAPEGKLTMSETRRILSTLLSALAHLHGNNVVHRDVKAENILFASRSRDSLMLLADFGHAKILAHGATVTDCSGTLSYLAPEVVARSGHSFPVDMWAVGVLTYFMLSGYMPFDCDTDDETKELISNGDYVFEPAEYWYNILDNAKDFMAQCFQVDPSKRLTAGDALDHPFISGSNTSPMASVASFQKLQDAVWQLHRNQRSISNFVAILAKFDAASSSSSRLSLEPLQQRILGERCFSPEQVTAFSTPVTSAGVSRQHSLNSIHALLMKLASSFAGRNGKASFVL